MEDSEAVRYFPRGSGATKIAKGIFTGGHRFNGRANFLTYAVTGHLERLSLKGQGGARFIHEQGLRGPPPTRGASPGRGFVEKNFTPHSNAHTFKGIIAR